MAAGLDASYLGCLFEELPPLGRRAHDDRLDVALVDDRVRVDREACRRQQVEQVSPPDTGAVEVVVAFTVSLHPPRDRDLGVVDRQAAGRVVEDDGHLCERRARAPLAARVDDLLHLPAAQVARLAGAEDPLDRVDDVGLAGAVGTDNRRHSALESNFGGAGERLEAQ
jgi:hypothetical protein